MRRIVGVLSSTALALSLACAVSMAGELTLAPLPHPDIASQLMLRLFGETADATAAFSAAAGDRASESPLRELALRVPAAGSSSPLAGVSEERPEPQNIALQNLTGVGAAYLSRAAEAGLISGDVRFASPGSASRPRTPAFDGRTALFTAAYQPVAPEPRISPDAGTMAFDGAPQESSQTGIEEKPVALGTENRSPKHGLSLNLSGEYQRTMPGDVAGTAAPALGSPAWQLPAASAALAAPNYAGSNRLSLGAGLAVPVFHGLTLNVNYDAQRGGFVLPGLQNLDATNNSYAGRLTYNIPYSSSSFSISAYQNRFGESVLPLNGYTQTGEDVNFTVKF